MSDGLRVTMIRCATLLLEWRDLRLLTDPWFAMHLRGLPCLRRPALAPRALGRLDALLVSHLHPDHYDPRAVAALDPPPPLTLVPPGSLATRVFRASHDGVRELPPGQSTPIGAATVHAVPGPHTLPRPDEINFVLELPGWGRVFFGGDARFDGAVLTEVARRFAPFRLALLPVGGTRILGRRTVMNPADARDAALLLQAATVVPMHEGGVWLSVPPLSLHPGRAVHLQRLFAARGQADRVCLLREGQSVSLAAPAP